MRTVAFGFPSASLTGLLESTDTRDMAGDESAYAKTADPACPVAPVIMICAMVRS